MDRLLDKEPGALAVRQRWRRDGTLLWIDLWLVWRSTVAQPDLSEFEKLSALQNLEDIAAGIRAFRRAPRWRLLQSFAMAALSLGLSARPSVNELEALRARALAAVGSVGGRKGTVARRAKQAAWNAHATELALEADPNLSNEKIANLISDWWKHEDPKCPGHRRFTDFTSKLREEGKLPQRTGLLRK